MLCQYLGGPRAAANLQIDDMLDLPPSSPSPSSPILQAVRASQEPVAAEFAATRFESVSFLTMFFLFFLFFSFSFFFFLVFCVGLDGVCGLLEEIGVVFG